MKTLKNKIRQIKKKYRRKFLAKSPVSFMTQLRRSMQLEFRKSREAKTFILSPEDYSRLRFYQFTQSTADFFFEKVGHSAITIPDTPHFQLARALVGESSEEIEAGTALYKDYLDAISPTSKSAPRELSIAAFKKTLIDLRTRPRKSPPIILTQILPDSEFFVVDGNYRIAMAMALGKEINVELWPFDLAFMKFSPVMEFYGTRHNNRPYQSIFFRQMIALPGRRVDTIERLKMIPAGLLSGARVLDIASNFGMSSILTRSFGAASVLGLEISHDMVDLASRFSMFEGVYPDVKFRKFNIDSDSLGTDERFDIGFMFSIYAHLSDPNKLTRIAEHNIRKYVVFESHPGGVYERYRNFFESGLFESVDELGRLPRSVFKPEEKTRILWLCRKTPFI